MLIFFSFNSRQKGLRELFIATFAILSLVMLFQKFNWSVGMFMQKLMFISFSSFLCVNLIFQITKISHSLFLLLNLKLFLHQLFWLFLLVSFLNKSLLVNFLFIQFCLTYFFSFICLLQKLMLSLLIDFPSLNLAQMRCLSNSYSHILGVMPLLLWFPQL